MAAGSPSQTPAAYLDDVQPGDSIALNGACMTVTTLDRAAQRFTIDISAESLARTAGLNGRSAVNLEKALRVSDRLGGHLVSGHVDGVGTVTHFASVGESFELRVMAPAELRRFVANKGSITVNGVSLTVNRLNDSSDGCEFSINLIPHTLQSTTLGQLDGRAARQSRDRSDRALRGAHARYQQLSARGTRRCVRQHHAMPRLQFEHADFSDTRARCRPGLRAAW